MNKAVSPTYRIAVLICIAAAALAARRAAAADPNQTDAFPTYESYIKVSGETAWISGDDASFAPHTGLPAAGSFGIEDLHFTKDVTDTTTVTVDGHAMDGTDDYLASLNIETDKVGSIEAGYKRFRTFYDGVGGFFPLTDEFQRLSPESLHVDRGTFWFDAKLARPDTPVFTLSLRDEIRTGATDSTSWAPTINPDADIVKGAFVGNALPANTPYINPNIQELNEHHRILDASMVATFGNTTETLKVTLDSVNNDDQRDYVKYPNSAVIADPQVTVEDDRETRSSTTVRVLQQTETKLSDKVAVDVGLTYAHLSSDNGGDWLTPTYSTTAKAVYTADTAAAIYGGSTFDDYVGNIFLKLTPSKDWLIDAGFRDEFDAVNSSGGFTNTTLATGATTIAPSKITTNDELTYSHYLDHTATPELSLQFLGIDRVCLYGTFDDCINQGSQHWINPYAATSISGTGVVTTTGAPIGSVFFQDANQNYEDLKLGANWNQSSILTLRAEVFHKDHENQFVGANDIIGTGSYGGLFVTGYMFNGAKLSAVLKPLPQLTFTTSYQPQSGTISVTANIVNGGTGNEITSGKARGQMIGESVNWTPTQAIYLQGNVSIVYNYIQTAYPVVVVSATTDIATPIENANNNYVFGSALCGFVLDKDTDAQVQGTWQRADNFNPQISLGGEPYGSSYLEESATIGLKHKFNPRLIGDIKVGYLRLTDPTTGGFTNYNGPLAYIALTYSL